MIVQTRSDLNDTGPKKFKRVAYLGPAASYSHQAALTCFENEEYILEPQSQIKDAFAAVQATDRADFAVVPFENSTYGTVGFTLDLLVDREAKYPDLLVCGELYLPVRHCLVGDPSKRRSADLSHEHAWDDDVSTVYSHPAAFGQCEKFLSLDLKGVEKQEVSSTSRAAEMVAQEGPSSRSVAISSSLAANIHGLELLAESIQDQKDNSTRFFLLKNGKSNRQGLAPSPHPPSSANDDGWKTLISFTLAEQPSGTLAGALQAFSKYGLNLTGINSRPSLEHAWHYVFLIEVQGKREDTGGVMNQALKELDTKTKGWKCKLLHLPDTINQSYPGRATKEQEEDLVLQTEAGLRRTQIV
ncbi:MAG: hypothetical protein Q9221_000121 [Calogaya cf. arnoldii]